MQNTQTTQPRGSLRISQDVIATIANHAASEIEGVVSMGCTSSSLKAMIAKRTITKPVSISINDDVAIIDIMINVKHGTKITATSELVQQAVKDAVQNMTGITVSKVNVQVAGIVFEETAQEQ